MSCAVRNKRTVARSVQGDNEDTDCSGCEKIGDA